MNNKKRKIINLTEDENFFHIDARVSIPKSNIAQELIDDLLSSKDHMIKGHTLFREGKPYVQVEYTVEFHINDDGTDSIHIHKDAKELV